MQQAKCDIAIIGSGIGGMCAAALLAHAGYRVLVVEKLPQLGGRCSTIEYKGYKIPHVAQEQPVQGVIASIFAEVGAEFDLAVQPPIVYRIKGEEYELPRKGQLGFLLSQVCKNEAERNRISTALHRARTWNEPSASISFRDWLLQFTDNEKVLGLFQNIFAVTMMCVIHEVSAKDVIGYFNNGIREWSHGARPLGGNSALMESLAKAIRGRGSDIWTRCTAKKILTTDEVVRGIMVDREAAEVEVIARAVISNAGPKDTVKLVGEESLDKGYVKELKENIHHGSQMLIAFASDRPLLRYPGGIGMVGSRRVVNISCLTLTCPELSPPGKYLHTAQCQPKSEFAPLDPETEIEAAVEDLRENLAGFDRYAEILHICCLFKEDWPGYRNLPGYYPPQRTPIENLYNVGDGVAPFGWCATSGCALSARIVVDDIRKRFQPEET